MLCSLDRCYLSFEEYLCFGGDSGVGIHFDKAEFRARKLVDKYTCNRIRDMEDVPKAVKVLMGELITLEVARGISVVLGDCGKTAFLGNQAVSSFSNDGYSETYAEPLTAERLRSMEEELILTYLGGELDDNGVPLLYLGVD